MATILDLRKGIAQYLWRQKSRAKLIIYIKYRFIDFETKN